MSDDDIVECAKHLANRWAVLLYLFWDMMTTTTHTRGAISAARKLSDGPMPKKEERLKSGFDAAE